MSAKIFLAAGAVVTVLWVTGLITLVYIFVLG